MYLRFLGCKTEMVVIVPTLEAPSKVIGTVACTIYKSAGHIEYAP